MIHIIEIELPFAMELPNGFERKLSEFIDREICRPYEAANPGRVMWPAGHGFKPLWREPEEPEYDLSVYQISVSEREGSPKGEKK